jgi:hypothetical protein
MAGLAIPGLCDPWMRGAQRVIPSGHDRNAGRRRLRMRLLLGSVALG